MASTAKISNQSYPGHANIIAYLDSKDPSNWSFYDFLSSNFVMIVNSPPDANDVNGLTGTWWNRFKLEVEAKGHKAVKDCRLDTQKFFCNVISTRLETIRQQNIAISKSKVKIIADKQGIDLVGASCEFYGSEINSEYSNRNLNNNEHIIGKNERKRPAEASSVVTSPPNLRQREQDEPRTPEDKIRTTSRTEIDDDITYNDEEPYKNFSETSLSQQSYTHTTKVDSSLASTKEVDKEKKQTSKYINRDIASEALRSYQMNVLAGKRLIYNNVDVFDYACLNMKTTTKSPLCIGVINIHNSDCTKFLPDDFKHFIADQLEDPEIEVISFANGRSISKFVVDCEEEVIQYLDKFYDNDILLQSMSESELNMYVWTPLLRNAFLGKDDIKLSCGELASNSYNKLMEILDIGGRSAPKLDGKGLLKSLGTEILAQEDGVLNTRGKRKGDLKKLEYCSKIILTTLFFALPSEAKANITKIETYSIQSNGLRLTISVSKYLFENTIITMGLQDIEIPRTVEGFSKLVTAVKVILSWKSRTRKNTQEFYKALKNGHKRLENGIHFSPKKMAI
ncbi:hypothetical protein GLOIN_2v1488383 [Rhizophagus clarus]|uniref:Uncharacterized protein n=1 Tax=Rhizophagus clarus TaxID=94130 RepID=A0A8H3L0N5_9GLOM|nr:hypothetical protein GLOIN_2v1488383 [Rhizophagus clarus]